MLKSAINQLWAGVLTSALFAKRQQNILKTFKKAQDDLKQLRDEQLLYMSELKDQIKELEIEFEEVNKQTDKETLVIERLNDFII